MKRLFTRRFYWSKDLWRPEIWEISTEGSFTVERHAVMCTPGKTEKTDWSSAADALAAVETLIAEKKRDGFEEGSLDLETNLLLENWPNIRFQDGTTDSESRVDAATALNLRTFSNIDEKTQRRFEECLQMVKQGSKEEFVFNAPATEDEILELEVECDIVLPPSLRQFLLHFNGGFIWRRIGDDLLPENTADAPNVFSQEEKEDCSYPLFSLKRIKKFHEHFASGKDGSSVIAFCEMNNGEPWVLWSLEDSKSESPVLAYDHELQAAHWTLEYKTFAHFFIEYVEKHGYVDAEQSEVEQYVSIS